MIDLFLKGASVPLRNHPEVIFELAQKLHVQRNKSALDGSISHQGGTGKVTFLDWDSGLLGMPCGRLDAVSATDEVNAASLAAQLCERASEAGINHLSARFDVDDEHLSRGFMSQGFEVMDGITTFALRLGRSESFTMPDHVCLAEAADAEQVAQIGKVAFKVDRFHVDPVLSDEKCDELHEVWTRNSVLSKAADGVVILKEDGVIHGFVTCKIQADTKEALGVKIGTIVLVAIAPESQGKGLGKKLVAGSLSWFASQHCDVVDVGTQVANSAASKLYESAGFVKVGGSQSLRKVLRP